MNFAKATPRKMCNNDETFENTIPNSIARVVWTGKWVVPWSSRSQTCERFKWKNCYKAPMPWRGVVLFFCPRHSVYVRRSFKVYAIYLVRAPLRAPSLSTVLCRLYWSSRSPYCVWEAGIIYAITVSVQRAYRTLREDMTISLVRHNHRSIFVVMVRMSGARGAIVTCPSMWGRL